MQLHCIADAKKSQEAKSEGSGSSHHRICSLQSKRGFEACDVLVNVKNPQETLLLRLAIVWNNACVCPYELMLHGSAPHFRESCGAILL